MLNNLFSLFAYDVGIDLGTANIRIGVKDLDFKAIEPSVVAINKLNNEVLAVGEEAKAMLGRTPASVVAIRPLKDGVIVDFNITQAMISYFLNKVHQLKSSMLVIPRPRVLVGVPSSITEVEKQAVIDATIAAGAREAYVIEEPMAAAIGVGLPVNEPIGSMIVDIGGGTTDIAIISLGGIVVDKTINIAGDEMDDVLVDFMKDTYNLLIGRRTAERIKITVGSAYPLKKEKEMMVSGRDLVSGLPKSVKVTSVHVREALSRVLKDITSAIKEALEDAPPELISDIYERGMVISGGGSKLLGLDKFWEEAFGIPVKKAKEPSLSVLYGTLKALGEIEILRKLKESEDQLI